MRRAWQSVALAVLLTALIAATGGEAMADGETVKVLYGTGNIGKDEFHSLSADEQEKLMRGDSVVQDGRVGVAGALQDQE